AGATLTDPAAILARLDQFPWTFNVDGSYAEPPLDALTDGLIIIRYLSGLRGWEMLEGARAPTATNWTPEYVIGYIESTFSAPRIFSISPSDLATSVALDSGVVITFTKGMDPATLTYSNDATCGGTIQISADNFASCAAIKSIEWYGGHNI